MMVIHGYRALALKRWWLTLSAVKVYIPTGWSTEPTKAFSLYLNVYPGFQAHVQQAVGLFGKGS